MPLVTISPNEIREFFRLEPLTDYHVPINLQELEKEYMAKKDVIRGGALKAHIGTIETLPVIIATSREPFKKDHFTSWAVEVYRTLCRVFGEDEKNAMPISFMYMMI